jgi:hypothetical protein
MSDFQTIFAILPENARASVLTALASLLALQVLASVVVQALPSSAAANPRWGGVVRLLHRFGHMRFADEFGTLKLPGAPVEPNPLDATIAAQNARIAALEAQLDEASSRDTIAAPSPQEK